MDRPENETAGLAARDSKGLENKPLQKSAWTPAPLMFRPALVPKVWGGKELVRRYYGELPGTPNDEQLGEAWALSDRPGAESVVMDLPLGGERESPLAGWELSRVLRTYPEEILGRADWSGAFPLLIKYLDAQEDLSVQVHPNDELARVMTRDDEGHFDRGKNECWFVIDCDKGARIQYGLRPGCDETALRAALAEGDLQRELNFIDAEPGLFLSVPAGQVHALLAGTLLCEIQQSSDTTYRFYDWDRKPPRPLHVEESIAVTNFDGGQDAAPSLHSLDPNAEKRDQSLIAGEFFEVTLCRLKAGETLMLKDLRKKTASQRPSASTNNLRLLCGISGEVIFKSPTGRSMTAIKPGFVTILPHQTADGELLAGPEGALFLTVSSPELQR